MIAKTFSFAHADLVERTPASRARNENLLALAFAVFAAAILSLTLLPPQPASDPSEVNALEMVAGP